MTLPPCPIAGHDNPHHHHAKNPDLRSRQYPSIPGHTDDCADDTDEFASRCYSAHVESPEIALPPTIDARQLAADVLNAWTNRGWEPDAYEKHDSSLYSFPRIVAVLEAARTTKAPADLEVATDAPTPDPDEWVRVPHPTPLPPETPYRCWSYQTVSSIGWTPSVIAEVYVRRSDFDAILKPAPTPAEKLAEALNSDYTPDGDEPAWTPADVLAALDAAGLTLAERGEK